MARVKIGRKTANCLTYYRQTAGKYIRRDNHPEDPTILTRFLIITALLGFATPSFAGDITRADPGADFEWKSTECIRPSRPFLTKGAPQAQEKMQAYALKVSYYIDCLKQEAQRDFDKAQMDMQIAVQSKLQKEVDALEDDVEAMARSQ